MKPRFLSKLYRVRRQKARGETQKPFCAYYIKTDSKTYTNQLKGKNIIKSEIRVDSLSPF
jgi:hypothetical protein